MSESSDDEDQPLALTSSPPKHRRTLTSAAPGARKSVATSSTPAVNTNGKIKPEDSDSDDTPLNNRVASSSKGRTKPKGTQKRKAKVGQSEEGLHSEDDEPAPKKKTSQPKKKRKVAAADSEANGQLVKKAAPRKVKKESGSETETAKPLAKKKGKAKKEEPEESSLKKSSEDDAGENGSKKGKGKQKDKEEEMEDAYKWWEQDPDQTVVGDGTQKWTTLEHNGVIFPPPYQPLPRHVKMKYNS